MGLFSRKTPAPSKPGGGQWLYGDVASYREVLGVLYPAYFVEMLTRHRCPTTDEDVARLATVTAAAIGVQVGAFAARAQDPAALEDFCSRFADYEGQNRPVQTCDEMLAWIWAWDVRARSGIVDALRKWGHMPVDGSGLLTSGQHVPEADGVREDALIWRATYELNGGR